MFLNMLKFEWRYYVRQPSFYVTCLTFFLLPFLAMVSDSVIIGGANTTFNGSFAVSQTILVLGIFSMFLVVNFMATTATKNDSSHMTELLYTKPMNPLKYQLGRFFGTYLVILVVFAMVPLGILIGSWMPWLDTDRLGPTNLSFYLSTYFYFSVPTLFVFSAIFYSVGQKFKSMMSVYLAAVALFILYIVSGNFISEPEYRYIAALTDPFGLRTFSDITRYWTPVERDNQVINLEGVLLYNRLIWLGISVAILALFGKLASPLTLAPKPTPKKKKSKQVEVAPVNAKINYKSVTSGAWAKFKTRTLFEIKQIMFSPPFYILLIFSGFTIISSFFGNGPFYGTSEWALTKSMVTQIFGSFSLMMIVIITYYSGEVVWRERSSGMGDIVDSMPVFNMTFWLSKLIAVCLTLLSLFVIGMCVTITYQLIVGVNDLELGQYFISLFFFHAPSMLMMVVLAFFLQVLSPNKFVGMLLFLGYFLASLSFYQLGLEHNLLNFAASPMMQYSDLNGYGWYLETQAWYLIYWGAMCVILSTISYALWQRGPQVALKHRFKQMGYQMQTGGKVTLASAALVFVLSGSYIYYNTTIVNEYYSSDEMMEIRTDYEKQFDQYVNDPVPVITRVNALVDITPSERTIVATAEITVKNKFDKPISRFLVNAPRFAETWGVQLPNGSMQEVDSRLGSAWFVFEKPLKPGETLEGEITVTRTVKGFKDKGFDVQLVKNGTFINNFELFPIFGVNTQGYLSDRHERRKRDLPPPKRANKLEDEEFHNQSFFGKGNDFIDFETTISTELDQVAIAPGYLQKEWVEGDKRYFHYKMDSPMINFYSILSARLDVKKEVHKGINIEVYYHPQHFMNVDVMIESTKDSIDYFTEAFGPYQHKQMRIIEFPGYRSFAQSFANTVPYSENIGFTTDLRDPENIDPVYYVTAHELAHQWWAHQVGSADVQGSAILSESLSQYSAIMVMANKYGESKLRKFLKYELDSYLRGRTRESLEEMPLMRAENQSYIHYRKGSVVMMAIKDRLGEERLNQALRSLLQEFKFKSDPYPTTLDLVASLNAVSNSEEQSFIKDLFEEITLYDLQAKTADIVELDNGKYEVVFTIEGKRYNADGKGAETPADLKEYVDIVLFSEDPEDLNAGDIVLYEKKHLVIEGENTFKLIVDSKPKYAGVDPFVKLIDRDSSDNVIKL